MICDYKITLIDDLKQLLGVMPIFQIEAVLHDNQLFRDLLIIRRSAV